MSKYELRNITAGSICDCHTWPTIKEFHDYTVALEQKMKELNCDDLESAMKIIAGTARSMGVEVES